MEFKIEHLGQSGLRIDGDQFTILVDPYLSHSVQELESQQVKRKVPIPYLPHDLTMIDWVLVTHNHLDHCDPHTLPIIARVSPKACFIGPLSVRTQLEAWGIERQRIFASTLSEFELGNKLKVQAVPAAHPKLCLDFNQEPHSVGYFFKGVKHNLYLAGDTSVCDELLVHLKNLDPIDYALLPVNEDNYFRRRQGIIGNMSIREAFELAAEVGVKNVAPVHWDMFEVNSVDLTEIKSVYSAYDWPFKLIEPREVKL